MLAQEGVRVELIVIDDGSTDSSPKIIKSYRDKIVSLWQPNSRQAVAQNYGLRVATGEYIAYLDSDDISLPNRLNLQVQYLCDHPEIDMVYTATEYICAEGKSLFVKIPASPNPLRLLYLNDVPHSSVMHRRSLIPRIGYFDESYPNQDWDYWVRFSEVTRLGLIPSPLVKYREHPANLTHTRKNKANQYRWTRMILLRKTLIRRGHSFWLLLCYWRACTEWWFLSVPLWSEFCPKVWWRIHSIFNLLERIILSLISMGRAYPDCWKHSMRQM